MHNSRRETGAPVFRFLRFAFCMVYGAFFICPPLSAQAWYISNASGQALYPSPSRIVALRSDYCLGMSVIAEAALPPELRAYYQPSYIIDFRTLYEKGAPVRQQWVFRNDKGLSRLTAAAGIRDGTPALAFIERYDEQGLLIEEQQFSEEEQSRTMYFYENAVLVRSETGVKTRVTIPPDETEEPDAAAAGGEEPRQEWRETSSWTDRYRYSRSQSLRSVQRVVLSGGPQTPVISFPPLKPHPEFDKDFVRPKVAYHSTFLDNAVNSAPVSDVMYTTDDKGRVLTESRYDETGALTHEMKNNWARDRIMSVEWRSFDTDGTVLEERLVEYGYDAKDNRVTERNYVNGVLERTVKIEGGREIEELYMDGKIVLRATWENGRKIKEERVRGRQ
jgi:antitoxin component YwqK of YwqJK toxin-antitoxin module